MSEVMRIEGDVFVAGQFSSRTMGIPAATVTNDDVATAAGISASKLEHQYAKVVSQESATACADEIYVAHVGFGAGTILSFKCGAIVPCLVDATVSVDLLNNGVTVLNSAATLNSSVTARALVTATIDTAAYVAGDVLEIKFDQTTGGGTDAKGVFAEVILREVAE